MTEGREKWHPHAGVGAATPAGPGRVPLDRAELSEAIVRELGELFVSEPRQAGPRLVAADLDGIEQRLQELSRRVLGRRGVEVVEIVDVFPAWGHLWTVANAVFGAGTPRAAAWVEPLKRRLLDAGPAPILTALAELVPAATTATAADELRKARGYFTDHAARMDSPRFAARHVPIGSGAIESACTTLIQAREKQAGMRWSHDGAQVVASPRAIHRSGRWDHFWQTQPQRRRTPVAPRSRCTSAPAPPDTRAA